MRACACVYVCVYVRICMRAYAYGFLGLCVRTSIVLCCKHAHAVACDATPCRMHRVHSLGVTREIEDSTLRYQFEGVTVH